MALILALESSCDDSAAALVGSDRQILAQAVVGQNDAHRPFGGVVPEIAARAHVEILPGLVRQVLHEADIAIGEVDAIAATAGPGLIGGVMVGLLVGKGLALSADKPLIAVNHLEGHALSPRLVDPKLDFPYLLLLASGGHCQLLEVRGVGDYRRLATTIDDAAGEAFDKAAKLLGLGLSRRPGDRGAGQRRRSARRYRCRARWSAPRNRISASPASRPRSSARWRAASIGRRTSPPASSRRWSTASSTAPGARSRRRDAPSLVVAGGVAANARFVRRSSSLAEDNGRRFSVPPGWLCTDNAAMIGWAGAERFAAGLVDGLDAPARARWPLDPTGEKVRGAGVKA